MKSLLAVPPGPKMYEQPADILELFQAQLATPEKAIPDFEPFVRWVVAKGIKGLLEEYNTELKKYTGVCPERKAFDQNRAKNRYNNVICYDKSRVVLSDGKGSDYVHANFVRGDPLVKPEFIASQGPTAGTVVDFWRMVEFCGVQAVVQLCNFVEVGKKKCEAYFPRHSGEIMIFGDIKVLFLGTFELDRHITRTDLKMISGDGSWREVRHYHYRAWPDKHVPKSCRAVLRLLAYLRVYSLVLVHCSAGIGRTGTLLAVEMALQNIAVKKQLNLLEVAKKLRDQRCNAIQVELQYVTVALIVVEHALSTKIITEKSHPDLVKECHKLKAEFDALVPPAGTVEEVEPGKKGEEKKPARTKKDTRVVEGDKAPAAPKQKAFSREFAKDLFNRPSPVAAVASVTMATSTAFLWLWLVGASWACTLCPLKVPPRPRPINQYQIPSFPEFDGERMPQFCNFSRQLPLERSCREGFEKIFCTADKALEKVTVCANPDNPRECSRCAHQWQDSKWVAKWFDSLGKPGAGISDGNYYWLGDYETCVDLKSSQAFDGKYCRVELEVPDALVEDGCPQTDPLAIILGVCFPSSCTPSQLTDVSQSFSAYKLKVDCEFEVAFSGLAYLLIGLFGCWLVILFYATVQTEDKWYWTSLSLKNNANRALSTKREVDGLHALHGMEFLTFFLFTAGNVYNIMAPYIENVAFLFDGVSNMYMHLTNNYSYHVDGLFALSALYTTYLLHGKLAHPSDLLQVVKMRFVRFWPAYLFCILFMRFVFIGIAAGPMWIHNDTVERCSSNWWKNLLFINNFWPAKNTCVDFGYAISLEAQYFVLLVLLIYLARSHLIYSVAISVALLVLSIAFTFYRVLANSLPPAPLLTAEPIEMGRMEGLLDSVLTSFFCRVPAYSVGFLFGIIMSRGNKEGAPSVFSKMVFVSLVVMGFASALFVLFSLLPFASNNVGSSFFLALYSAIHRPLWAFFLLNFLYLCEHGYFSWTHAILTWRIFSPLAKLTWIAIVCSEPIILYFFTALNRPSHATHWSTIYSAISAATMSYLAAFLIDIFIQRPVRSLLLREDRHRLIVPAARRAVPFQSTG